MKNKGFYAVAGSIVCGLCIAFQGRLGAAVATRSGSAYFAGFVMFASSLILIGTVTLANRPVRLATGQVIKALWRRKTPRKLLFAGPIGAFVAVVQAAVIALTGTSFYSVAFVLGQIAGGAVIDSAGVGREDRVPLYGRRLIGMLIAALSVSISIATIGAGRMVAVAVPLLFVLAAGVLVTGQHVLNSKPTILTGRPEPAALFTYVVGTAVMSVVMLLLWPVARPDAVEPWFLLCGVLGPVAILLAASLVSTLGAFTLTLGIVTGQMSGALLLDLVWPSQLSIGISSVVAAVLMVAAMLVASRRKGT